MFGKWIADGIGWGIMIFAAGFTLVALTGTTAFIIETIIKIAGGSDDENIRPV